MARIFDPYFTTKGADRGTGLGLSVVHGIVKSHNGCITLQSTPGLGTTVEVFFPKVEDEDSVAEIPEIAIPVGSERILLVDDEEGVARAMKMVLESLGYEVIVRNSSIEAMELFQQQPDYFNLVITDQTMPDMTGADLAGKLLRIRPDFPIILCSGYSSLITEQKAKDIGIREFALKPMTRIELATLVRAALDSPTPSAS